MRARLPEVMLLNRCGAADLEPLAKGVPTQEVDTAIVAVGDGRPNGQFHRLFATPDDPIAIIEEEALSLVFLEPGSPGRSAAKFPRNQSRRHRRRPGQQHTNGAQGRSHRLQ